MTNMNPTQIFQILGAWQKFTQNHPKFPKFLNAIRSEGIQEGTILEMTVTSPEGKKYCSNLKVTKEDLELFEQIREMNL